uniref:aldehyde oxygenase (deformylating) n=1 Tax=Oryza brachyantha TaxID=4533 RepID=J3MEE7_ORYBR
MYMALGGRSMDRFRLHSREEEEAKNLVSKLDVVKTVLFQQLVQAAVAATTLTLAGERRTTSTAASYLTVAVQFAVAMVVLDGWQYAWHPVEGLLLDTVGGAVAFLAYGMSPRASVVFFSLCAAKGVDDHCGLWLPAANPLQRAFRNNTAYHDVHHQRRGGRYNYSQPFFVTWDKVFGTHMPFVVEARPGGGLQARPAATPGAGAGGPK